MRCYDLDLSSAAVTQCAFSASSNLCCCRRGGAAGPCTADIAVWDITTATRSKVLSYHPFAIQALAFSADGSWLVSIGRDPERSVVIWDVARGEAVSIGRADHALQAVSWLHSSSSVQFVTAGAGGALLWTLEPTHLAQQALTIPQVGGARAASCLTQPVRIGNEMHDKCARADVPD